MNVNILKSIIFHSLQDKIRHNDILIPLQERKICVYTVYQCCIFRPECVLLKGNVCLRNSRLHTEHAEKAACGGGELEPASTPPFHIFLILLTNPHHYVHTKLMLNALTQLFKNCCPL